LSSNKKNLSIEQINEEVREFLYIITHDLKNPVRGIKQASDFLLADYKDALGEDGSKILDMLQTKSRLLSDMIDGINNYSKVNFKQDQLVDIDFALFLDVVVGNINRTVLKNSNGRNLIITKEFDLMITLQGDEVKFSQILHNLLLNLVNFSKPDLEEIYCLVQCKEDPTTQFYTCSLTCTDIKFDTTRLAKLFAPFQEINVHTKTVNTMMTLTLAKKIVESYGGEISVESAEGKGLAFTFTYPKMLPTKII